MCFADFAIGKVHFHKMECGAKLSGFASNCCPPITHLQGEGKKCVMLILGSGGFNFTFRMWCYTIWICTKLCPPPPTHLKQGKWKCVLMLILVSGRSNFTFWNVVLNYCDLQKTLPPPPTYKEIEDWIFFSSEISVRATV